MSLRRESYSVLRIGNLLDGSINIDRVPELITSFNIPVKFVKLYGFITDKTIDDSINQDTGNSDYLLKIDDGTGSMWIRSSSPHCEDLKKWDFIRTIGYITLDTNNGKDYEIMIIAESVNKETDPNWELVHVIESLKRSNKKQKPSNKTKQRNKSTSNTNTGVMKQDTETSTDESGLEGETSEMESLAQKIERILRENDSGNGVEFSFILKAVGDTDESEVDDILFELAYEGKVYQPRPDFYRIMD